LEELVHLKIDGVSVVKAVHNESAAFPNIGVIDLKINVYGPLEDQVYAAFPVLIKNIRRGNTVLELKNKEGGYNYSFGRKGLEKFFDLRFEHISKE